MLLGAKCDRLANIECHRHPRRPRRLRRLKNEHCTWSLNVSTLACLNSPITQH